MNDKIQVLIADDNSLLADALAASIERFADMSAGVCCLDGPDITEAIKNCAPQVLLLDLFERPLERTKGLDLLLELGDSWRRNGVEVIVFLTVFDITVGGDIPEQMRRAVEDGLVDGHIRKPVDTAILVETVRGCLRKVRSTQ